jgi:alkaline phosphatase
LFNYIVRRCNKLQIAVGLFAYSHLDFEADRDTGPNGDPSLADMTRVALSILAKNPRGFLLFVEGKQEHIVRHGPDCIVLQLDISRLIARFIRFS